MPAYAKYAIFVPLALLALYELYSLFNGKPDDTISAIVWRAAAERPLIPFLFGLVMGHFFWPRGSV